MEPEPDVMLNVIATKLVEQIVPHVDDYLKGELNLLALTIRAAAERFDVEADVLIREHRALTAIFDQARQQPAFAAILEEMSPEPVSFRLSDLRACNRRALKRLTLLDAQLDEADGEPSALRIAIDTFLRDRTVLNAFNVSPFPTKDLAALQSVTMR